MWLANKDAHMDNCWSHVDVLGRINSKFDKNNKLMSKSMTYIKDQIKKILNMKISLKPKINIIK